jgi:hypothetical protein
LIQILSRPKINSMTMKSTIAALSFLTVFASCEKNDDAPVVVEEATVMIKHASPDAPAVDILVDGVKTNSAPVTFNSNTGYIKVKAGARTIRVNAAGTTNAVINATATLVKDKNYSIFAANRLANIEPIVVEDNLTTPSAGKAHVRFVHLSPDAPAVNIVAGTAATNLFSAVTFKTTTAFIPVDATTAGTAVTLNVRNASNNNTVLAVPVTLIAGKIYTIVARGLVTPPTGNTNTLAATVITNK